MGEAPDLAVLQMGVNVFDEGIIWVPDWETQLAERGQLRISEPTVSISSCGERKELFMVHNQSFSPHFPACPFLGLKAGSAVA